MTDDEPARTVEKGDHYRHPDGTTEVVYAVEGEVVLTIREYRRQRDFERAVGGAEYEGIHDGVAALPDVDAMEEGEG